MDISSVMFRWIDSAFEDNLGIKPSLKYLKDSCYLVVSD